MAALQVSPALGLGSWGKKREATCVPWTVSLGEPYSSVAVPPTETDFHTYPRASIQGPTARVGRKGEGEVAMAVNEIFLALPSWGSSAPALHVLPEAIIWVCW